MKIIDCKKKKSTNRVDVEQDRYCEGFRRLRNELVRVFFQWLSMLDDRVVELDRNDFVFDLNQQDCYNKCRVYNVFDRDRMCRERFESLVGNTVQLHRNQLVF